MDGKIINLNKNKSFTEETTTLTAEDPKTKGAYALLRQSGDVAKPSGFEYVGSAAFHMYKSETIVGEYVFMSVTPVGDATEGMCDVAWKRLRDALMNKFQRAAPRKRK